MDIKLGLGIEDIHFGMTQDEIESLLGKPDRTCKDEEYGESEPMIQYNSIKTRLTFYKNNNGKLGYIRSSNPDLKYKNQRIIGKTILESLNVFNDIPKDKWELEQYDFWIQYFNEDWWITLRFDYDKLSEIEIGVPFKNDEEYDWPINNASS